MSEALTRALIECDGATAPPTLAGEPWTVQRTLRTHGRQPDLNLRIDRLSEVVQTIVEPVASDLLRIAAYAYGADQELSRGGDRDPTDTGWRREIALCVPVVALDVWTREDVQKLLCDTLHFATDDTWRFAFSPGDADKHRLPMFDERQLLHDPDCVLMFSGGADSLCAAVRAVAADDSRPVLVSHRSATYFHKWQTRLVEELRRALPQWHFPHLGCWVQRRHEEARERTRRARAFLVASLGAAVALQLGLTRVLLADNGIVSLNLALNGGVVGAQASRSTHPRFLHLFNRLLQAVFTAPVRVTNPQWAQTRGEVLTTLWTYHCPELLGHTRSCSRAHGQTAAQPHCGTCSQCVDRRFGVLAAGLDTYDPPSGYAKDVFASPLAEGPERTIAESYCRLAQQLDRTHEDELFNKFSQLFDAVLPTEQGSVSRARATQRLLKQHADDVGRVIKEMYARLGGAFWAGEVASTSLLGLLHSPRAEHAQPPTSTGDSPIWRRVGRFWWLSFRGRYTQVADLKGMRYLAQLLRAPHTEISALQLVESEQARKRDASPATHMAVRDAVSRQELRVGGEAALDAGTKSAILRLLRKLEDLRAERDTAERMGESEEASRLTEQIQQLDDELSATYGRGNVRLGEQFKRQRQAVGKDISKAIGLIGESHTELGRHLRDTVHTGLLCIYQPDPPVSWLVSMSPSAT